MTEQTSTALSEWTGADDWAPDGTEGIAPPAIPSIKVVYGVSQMAGADKHGGEFYRTDMDALTGFFPEIDIIPLVMRPERSLFLKGDAAPACRSADGLRPLPNQRYWIEHDEPQPRACVDGQGYAICALAQWGQNHEPPPCSSQYVLIAEHEGAPVQFRIKGKLIKAWREFIVHKQQIAKQLRVRSLPLCAFVLSLSTTRVVKNGDVSYDLNIEPKLRTRAEAMTSNAMLDAERARYEEAMNDDGPDPEVASIDDNEWLDESDVPPVVTRAATKGA